MKMDSDLFIKITWKLENYNDLFLFLWYIVVLFFIQLVSIVLSGI